MLSVAKNRIDMQIVCDLQHKLLTKVTDNRPLLELIREVKAEVTVEEKDIDVVDLVVNFVLHDFDLNEPTFFQCLKTHNFTKSFPGH